MDKQRIENAFREILLAIGEDPDREGLQETPKRVANMYEEIFSGLNEDPAKHLKMFREGQSDERQRKKKKQRKIRKLLKPKKFVFL